MTGHNLIDKKLSDLKVEIKKIEKIYNPTLYERFLLEFKFMLKKHPNKEASDIVQHLFHGTDLTMPSKIYDSEFGLDPRYAKESSRYGLGAYFS
jgi:hypothetical protein